MWSGCGKFGRNLILTQGVCEVCAVPTGSVEDAVEQLPFRPRVLSLDAHTLDGILETVEQVADAAGAPERGRQATARLRERIARVEERVAGEERPRVLALEWLDPPFAPGHWVPEMVTKAGGENLLGQSGERSTEVGWAELEKTDPNVLLLLPCGYDLLQARNDADQHRERLRGIAARAIDGGGAWIGHGSFFSRSGPRVVRGIEVLGRIFHPTRFPRAELDGEIESWC